MDHRILFTPRLYTLQAWLDLLAAIAEMYPDARVELKPAGNMTAFYLILPQEEWREEDGKFFDRLLYGQETISTWAYIDC